MKSLERFLVLGVFGVVLVVFLVIGAIRSLWRRIRKD